MRIWDILACTPAQEVLVRTAPPENREEYIQRGADLLTRCLSRPDTPITVERRSTDRIWSMRRSSVVAASLGLYGVLSDQDIVGILLANWTNDGTLDISHMAVSPEYQGRKIGSALLSEAIAHATHAGAHVITLCSVEPPRLFTSHGFTPIDPYSDLSESYLQMSMRLQA
jgi:ribosomal protein S18 acetylase RimI-like enzyme